jgi:hypothetical protein
MRISSKTAAVVLALTLLLGSFTTAFADTTTYPSDVMNTPLITPVKYLIDKKVLSGYPDGTFKPDNLITRAEIAVAVAKMTNRANDLEAMAKKNVFTDLTGYDWAKGHINALVDVGILKGKTATTYAPGSNISYAELITILVRTNSSAASELEAQGNWPNNYIQYVQMYNMLGNVVVTDWNAPATRGDTAMLMYRLMPKS